VTDEVHAAVHGMQSAGRDAVADRLARQADGQKLEHGHHAVLASGQASDPSIRGLNATRLAPSGNREALRPIYGLNATRIGCGRSCDVLWPLGRRRHGPILLPHRPIRPGRARKDTRPLHSRNTSRPLQSATAVNSARKLLNAIRIVALLDALLLAPLVFAALTDREDWVSVLGPIHGVGFLLLIVMVVRGVIERYWGWWFPALVVVTLGPPGSLIGDVRIRRDLDRAPA
jgi:hypothetical protein